MSEKDPKGDSGNTDKYSALPVPLAPTKVVVGLENQGHNTTSEQQKRQEKATDFLRSAADFARAMGRVANAAWLMGFVGVGTLITGIAQCSFNKAQVVEMRAQSEAAREGLRQSKAALDATVDAARQDQRAWVGINGFEINQLFAAGNPFSISVKLLNVGKTPATNIVYDTWSGIIDSSQKDEAAIFSQLKPGAPLGADKTEAGSLFPGVTSCSIGFYRPISKSDYDAVVSMGKAFYFAGNIRYNDVFGKTHTSKFFWRYIPTNKPEGVTVQMRTHNSAD